MIKSMTGFSKTEAHESGMTANVEIKSLNGRYLEINCRTPRSLSHKEFELRDLVKKAMTRGNVFLNVTIDKDEATKPFILDSGIAAECYDTLKELRAKLKIKDAVKIDHVLQFSSDFFVKKDDDTSDLEWKLVSKAVKNALRSLNTMRGKEGRQILKDMNARMNKIENDVEELEKLGLEKIPAERDRLRQRVAKLFESDEIDEQRLQTELVLIADKLDISEECVRMRSHLKFYFETIESPEPSGKKVNFLLQEMNREINTIGSKANDAEMAHIVVGAKEDLERIREQVQNME